MTSSLHPAAAGVPVSHSAHDGGSAAFRPSSPVSEPTEVDYVLALLESKQSHDRLSLTTNPAIKQLLASYAIEDQRNAAAAQQQQQAAQRAQRRSPQPPSPGRSPSSAAYAHRPSEAQSEVEQVLFSDLVTKLNRKGKAQQRVLLLTSRAVYNLDVGGYKRCKRRILIGHVCAVTVSDDDDDFVLHVRDEYDYHYRSSRRADILHLLSRRFKSAALRELPISVTHRQHLQSFVTTKQQLQQQQSSIVDSSSHSLISSTIRALVSKKKIRYRQHGFDLDLTYITPRVIAMGFPSEDVESLYRNPYSDVYRLLETRHHARYAVYNLCSERHYDGAKFHQRVFSFPFDDHNAPTLLTMAAFVEHAQDWLRRDADNVIAVHCKAGKGRTGVMLACLLLHSGVVASWREALHEFGFKRTENAKGVTIPSQQRFVSYFEQLLRGWGGAAQAGSSLLAGWRGFDWAGEPKRLQSLTLLHYEGGGGELQPYCAVYNHSKDLLLDSRSAGERADSGVIPLDVRVRGEFKLVVFLGDRSGSGDRDKEAELCHCWLHSSFIGRAGQLTLDKPELDKICKDRKHKKVEQRFALRLHFTDEPEARCAAEDEEFFAPPAAAANASLFTTAGRLSVEGGAEGEAAVAGTQAAQWKATEFVRRLQSLQQRFSAQELELEKATRTVAELRAEISRDRDKRRSSLVSGVPVCAAVLPPAAAAALRRGRALEEEEDEDSEEEDEDD